MFGSDELERMTIDELAARVNTSARNIRSYLERGLLHPPRMVARTGFYDSGHDERVHTMHRLQREVFSLAGIRALLDAWQRGDTLEDLIGARAVVGVTRSGAADASDLFPMTKFQRPPARAEHIVRHRCLTMIRAGVPARHVLISAAAGSGKSTLAAQLAGTGAVAWVSLEPADEDPGRFWAAVIVGLRTAQPDFGEAPLAAALAGARTDRLLIDIAAALAAVRAPLTLVLDDLHRATERNGSALAWLLEHVDPAACRIVICTRTEPQLPSARLALDGRLVRIGSDELAFDGAETREFLNDRLALRLSTALTDELAAFTEGWASGVYLAALSLRAGVDPTALVATVTGGDRRIQEYFADEVLLALDPALLAFLEGVCMLERFNADLCDTVLGRTDSREAIAELHRSNLFVIALDPIGHWHRLHHTLAAILRRRTADARDADARRIRAGRWFEARDAHADAIEHYLAGAADDEATRLLAAVYPRFMNTSRRGGTLVRWLSRLPADAIERSPDLALASAGVAGLRGDRAGLRRWVDQVRSLARDADRDDGGELASTIDVMRACFHFGDVEAGLAAARAAHATAPLHSPWRPMACACVALLAYLVDGPTDELLAAAQEVIADPAAERQPIALAGAWALKGLVLAERGEPGATHAARQAAHVRTAARLERVPQAAQTWSTTARVHLLTGAVDEAAHNAAAGYDVVADIPAHRDGIGAVVPSLIVLVAVHTLQGHTELAEHHAAEARRRLAIGTGTGRLPELLLRAQSRRP